jgi:hypothetical protein
MVVREYINLDFQNRGTEYRSFIVFHLQNVPLSLAVLGIPGHDVYIFYILFINKPIFSKQPLWFKCQFLLKRSHPLPPDYHVIQFDHPAGIALFSD